MFLYGYVEAFVTNNRTVNRKVLVAPCVPVVAFLGYCLVAKLCMAKLLTSVTLHIWTGFGANLPIALAPGMGMNAYFT